MTRSAPNLLKSASLAPVLLACLPSLAGAEGFIEDASVSLGLRNLYFNRDFRQPGAAQSKQEEWAQGFLLQAKSGYTQGTLGLGVELIGQLGLKLDSSPDRAGSGLLPRHADGRAADDYARLGVAPKLKLSNTELKLGELLPELPILLRNDGRLLPQTFQG
ncbi:OprD family outer membrane porin, partial [Pseudomonas aeruginosa]